MPIFSDDELLKKEVNPRLRWWRVAWLIAFVLWFALGSVSVLCSSLAAAQWAAPKRRESSQRSLPLAQPSSALRVQRRSFATSCAHLESWLSRGPALGRAVTARHSWTHLKRQSGRRLK
jgi:hypothetical protein